MDGELLIGILTDKGWQKTLEPEKADLIIVNSCGFIEPAKRESIEAVITARTAYPQAKILLAGCLAERYGDIFKTEFEEADAFFGNGDLSQLPILIEKLFPDTLSTERTSGKNQQPTEQLPAKDRPASSGSKQKIDAASPSPLPHPAAQNGERYQPVQSAVHGRPFLKPAQKGVCCGSRPELLNFPRSAFIKITEGCDNCCSFCAIPLIRGSVRSRPMNSIVNEIQDFVRQGYKEFNLIGQDLAVYEAEPSPYNNSHEYSFYNNRLSNNHLNNGALQAPPQEKQSISEKSKLSGLAQLLQAISGIKGKFNVRLLYIHPDHFPPDILPVMTADTRFLPYFDIPFQSGSDPIIREMNRCGSAEAYLKLIETIRAAFRTAKSPYGEAVIRTTFLTGFPGETQADFERTAAFLQAVQSLWSGAFAYSQEEGTKAADMKKQVPANIAEQRKTALNELQLKITEQKLAAFCGLETDVLIEEIIPQEQNTEEESAQSCIALGRAWFQAPEVDGAVVVNFFPVQKDSEGQPIAPGSLVRVRITALRGIDLEADAL